MVFSKKACRLYAVLVTNLKETRFSKLTFILEVVLYFTFKMQLESIRQDESCFNY